MSSIPREAHVADDPFRVIVAGGDIGALEVVFALREERPRVSVTLLTAEPELAERAMSVLEPFAGPRARHVAMDEAARDGGAWLVVDTLDAVDSEHHRIRTATGETLSYDALLVAGSPSLHAAVPGATTWTPDADADVTGGLLRDVEEHYSGRVAFVQPEGPGWPLAVYELALLTARAASEMGIDDAELTVVTPELVPLAAFGADASELVAAELRAAGVKIRTGVRSAVITGGTTLTFGPGDGLPVDRVLAMPGVRGPAIDGLEADDDGFLVVDDRSCVLDSPDVWAIGDGTSRQIKHASLTIQEADFAARDILARALGQAPPPPQTPILRGMLLTGEMRLLLEATGGPHADEAARRALWWPMTKIAGSRVGNYLAVPPPPDLPGAPVIQTSVPLRQPAATVVGRDG